MMRYGCGCLVVLLFVGLLVVAGSAVAAPLRTPVLGNLRFRCTLGLEQTNASVTVRGPLAGHQCRKLLDKTSAFPVRIFSISHYANSPVVCSFTESYVKVTIRDDGVLQLLGNNLCTIVKNIVASAGPSATPRDQASANQPERWLDKRPGLQSRTA